MAFEDVLRDTNNKSWEGILSGEQAIVAEMEKLEGYDTQKLWEMHTKVLIQSARGQAILRLLKERNPEEFEKSTIK